MFQEIGLDPREDPEQYRPNAKALKEDLVRLYLHPHDARTLHLSFDV